MRWVISKLQEKWRKIFPRYTASLKIMENIPEMKKSNQVDIERPIHMKDVFKLLF